MATVKPVLGVANARCAVLAWPGPPADSPGCARARRVGGGDFGVVVFEQKGPSDAVADATPGAGAGCTAMRGRGRVRHCTRTAVRSRARRRDLTTERAEEDEETITGISSKKTPSKKTPVSDRANHYTFRSVMAVFRYGIARSPCDSDSQATTALRAPRALASRLEHTMSRPSSRAYAAGFCGLRWEVSSSSRTTMSKCPRW